MRLMNVSKTAFLSHNPTLFGTFGGYSLFEHPTCGDTAPVIMITPSGDVIETCFWDMDDLNSAVLELCIEIDSDTEGTDLYESNSESGL